MKKTINQYLQEWCEKGAVYEGNNIKPATYIGIGKKYALVTDRYDWNEVGGDIVGCSIYDILYSPESNFWEVMFGHERKETFIGEWSTFYEKGVGQKVKSIMCPDGPIAYLESIERPE